jgi:SAM-dependent methyltransferase
LQPRRVLEVGCGTGLLLARLAPDCERYLGLDFSARALRNIEELMQQRAELRHVELLERNADDLSAFADCAFDTVIINSVAQYLPSLRYLRRVLESAVRLVRPGGHVFVGDVRDLRLLGAFHTAVETFRAPPASSVAEWKELAEQAQLQETELVIDPAFFWSLGEELAAVEQVETLSRRGRFHNELTQFRYDVVLHVGPDEPGTAGESAVRSLHWEVARLTLDQLDRMLAECDELVVRAVPNARVSAALAQLEIRRNPLGLRTVDDVRQATAAAGGIDPDALWRLGERRGFAVEVRLADSNDAGRVDVRFTRSTDRAGRVAFAAMRPSGVSTTSTYATDPLRGRRARTLIPRLRQHIGERLPEYMIPTAYVWLDALPLTPNGKVDRKSLRAPENEAYLRRAWAAPVGETERALAEIWSQVLRLERVGRHDNFFELGGHSLLAMRVIERMRARGLYAEARDLFEAPRLVDLAAAVTKGPVGIEIPPNLIPIPPRRRREPSEESELHL